MWAPGTRNCRSLDAVLDSSRDLLDDEGPALHSQLEDPDEDVREAALRSLELGDLAHGELTLLVPALVASLADDSLWVQRAAVATLGKLDAAILQQHSEHILALFEHSAGNVRQAAVETLGHLEPLVLASLPNAVAAIIARLEDTDPRVRRTAFDIMGALEAAAPLQLATIVAGLEEFGARGVVRMAALQLRGKIGAAALAHYVCMIR